MNTNLPTDDERQMIGTVLYYRVPSLDKRIARGDDFAGDAWVRFTTVGHQPDADPTEKQPELATLRAELDELREALEAVLSMSAHGVPGEIISYRDHTGAMKAARAALARCKG